jgi:hypothetical protein
MIQPIVEGDGEVSAVPILLRRLLPELGVYTVQISRPIRQMRTQLVQEANFRRAMRLASLREENRAILVLFDADDDCARDLVPQMNQWAAEETPSLPTAVVLARREYEAWFLAAIESLRGKGHVRENATYPADPEARRGAKEALRKLMTKPFSYQETADQPVLSGSFELGQAYRRASSFRKLVREVCRLLEALGCQPALPVEWTG